MVTLWSPTMVKTTENGIKLMVNVNGPYMLGTCGKKLESLRIMSKVKVDRPPDEHD